jgi:hypothetical protein
MKDEKRKGMHPIPGNYRVLLTNKQIRALKVVEKYGWKLAFVRRLQLHHPIPVIVNKDDIYGILIQDGGVDLAPNIDVRRL